MKRLLLFVGASVALVFTGISAAQTSEAEAAPRDLLDFTCGDYIEALSIANPGVRATAMQKADAEDAQDDIAEAMLWVHGYQSGKQAGAATEPLTEAWMRDTVVKLAQSCKTHGADGTLRLADAAARL